MFSAFQIFFTPRIKLLILAGFINSLLLAVMASFIPMGSKIVIDFIIGGKLNPAKLQEMGLSISPGMSEWIIYLFSSVNGFLYLIACFSIIFALISLIQQITIFNLRQGLTARVNQELFKKILAFPLLSHMGIPDGYLASRVFQDSNSIERFVSNTIPSLATQFLRLSFGLIILSKLSMKMTLVCLGITPVYLLINFFFYKPVRRQNQKTAEAQSLNFSYVQGNLSGIETVKAFNQEPLKSRVFSEKIKELINIRKKSLILNMSSHYLTRIAQTISMIILLWIGLTNIKNAEMSLGDLAAFMSYIGYLSGPIEGIAFFYLGLQPILVAYRRIFQILDFATEPDGAVEFKDNVEKIEICDLSFSFKNNQIFDNWSCFFEKGNQYFIPWISGKGKTTLARLLCKFSSPDSGNILFNSVNIQSLKTSSIRQKIGYMTQETHLFSGTIRDNLLLANPEATDESLEKALCIAEAWDFVQALPEKLDSELNDRGTNLSAGQRQRLSIARIILKSPDILLLDEPFANLDNHTAEKVYQNMQKFLSTRITLILSHQKEFCSESQLEKTVEVPLPNQDSGV